MWDQSDIVCMPADAKGDKQGPGTKLGSKRGHSTLKQDSDSDRDGSENYDPAQKAAAAAAAAKAKK